VTVRLRVLAAVAALTLASACHLAARTPYAAPAPEGAPALAGGAAAKLLVLVVADSDPRVTPPWLEKAERAADAVALALAQGGFRTAREPGGRWDVRVTVSALLRGGDFGVLVDADGKALDRWSADGRAWGPEELAELGRAVRQRLERSPAVAALAGVAAPAPAGSAAPTPPARAEPASPPAARRLAVLDFRGAAPAQVLALLADQARAAAAEAARSSGTAVLTREAVVASLQAQGLPAGPCADGACELGAGRAAGAALVVTGEVSAVGEVRFLVLRLVDVVAGTLVASQHVQAKDELALLEAARPAAAALFR
jgi:hypothetical protein